MAFQTILVQKEGAVDIVTLNRPTRFNAISRQMQNDLLKYFAGLREDYKTRAVILRGAGKAFCAGLDLHEDHELATKSNEKDEEPPSAISPLLKTQRRLVDIFRRMREAPQPIIAVIHGACCGGGLGLALASDFRYVTPETKMNVAMYKIGSTGGDMSISYFLPRLVGPSVAAELMMTGRFIYGERAYSTKLATGLFKTQAEMEEGARKLAEDMMVGDANALRLTKDCLQTAIDASSFGSALALEDRQQVLMVMAGDFKNRVGNFNAAAKSKL